MNITSQSGLLKLHHDPDDDPSSDPRTRQRYIESKTGETFTVKVSVHKGFELSTMGLDDAVHITIYYDGQARGWYTDLTKATILLEWSKGKPAEHTFSHVSNFCQVTQQWKQGATSFGALDTKETIDSQTSLSDVQNLGRIPSGGRTSSSYPAIDANSGDESVTEAGHRSDGENIERQSHCKYRSCN